MAVHDGLAVTVAWPIQLEKNEMCNGFTQEDVMPTDYGIAPDAILTSSAAG